MPRSPVLLAVGLCLLVTGCSRGGGSDERSNGNDPVAGNEAPTARSASITTEEDTPVTLALDVDDDDGDALSVEVNDDVRHGSLAISGSGRSFRASYAPAQDYNGSDTFVFHVSDGAARSAQVTLQISVSPVNDAPVADAASFTTNEDTMFSSRLTWLDPDSSTFSFAQARLPKHGTVSLRGDFFGYTPDPDYNGSDSFSVTISDDSGSSDTAEISMSAAPVNDAPVAVSDSATVTEGGSVSVLDGGSASLLANDYDVDMPVDRLTLLSTPVPQPLLLATNGRTLLGLDAAGGAAKTAATLRGPARALAVAGDGHTVYAVEQDGHIIYAADTMGSGHAPRALRSPLRAVEALARTRDDSLLAVTRERDSGTALLVRIDPADGSQRMLGIIAPQPDAAFTGLAFGTDGETLYALAGSGLYALDARSGAALPVAALVNTDARGLAVLGDGRMLTTAGGDLREIDMLTGDTRAVAPLGSAVGALAAGETGPAHGTVELSGDGSFVYTHDGSETLSDSFAYEMRDESGEVAQAVVTIAVTPVFDELPRFASSPASSVDEDHAYRYDVSVTDADAGDTIAITGAMPAWLHLTDAGDGTATLSGTPSQSAVGTSAVHLVATDAGGNVAKQDFDITVRDVNDAPRFTTSPVQQALVNATYAYELAATDEDGDPLAFSPGTPLPSWLGLLDRGDGTALLAGIPVADDIGDVTISIQVTDSAGAHALQAFVLSVVSTNAGPVFQSAPITSATEDALYAYRAVATDPNGDALAFTTVTPLPAWLAFTDNDDGSADLRGTPGGADAGDHAISIRVSDGNAAVTQSFTIRVAGVNDAPIITSTPVTGVAEGATYTYELHASDEEGDAITFSPATPLPPWLGLLDQGGGDALLAGIPIEDDVGVHQISIRASDSHGASSTQSFALTVTGVNGAPVITSAPCTHAVANRTYTCNVAATDEEGDAITILPGAPLPPWLGLLDFGDGTALLGGIPVDDDIGSFVIEIDAVDSHDAADTLTFTLTIGAAP